MPELPEMEAWRRQLNDPVSAFPIAQAGPAHIATLKTFDPPLDALEGRRFRGAERRGKRLLFPTDDGELVLLVHLMTAGRLKFLDAGEKGPKTPAFGLEFQGGSKLVLTENARKKRAGVWLLTPEAAEAELAHLGPEALGLGPERLGEIVHGESRRLHALLRDQRLIAGIGRAWANEILHTAKLSPYALSTRPRRRGGGAARGRDRLRARARPRAARGGRLRREDVPRPPAARRAVPRLRHSARAGRLRGAHDLLLPDLPDRRPGPQGPAALATPTVIATDGVVTLRAPAPGDVELLVAGRDEEFFKWFGAGATGPAARRVRLGRRAAGRLGRLRPRLRPRLAPAGEVNVGYYLFPEARGKGYASRAVELLLEHLQRDTGHTVATLLIHPENVRSLALARPARVRPERRGQRGAVLHAQASVRLSPWQRWQKS